MPDTDTITLELTFKETQTLAFAVLSTRMAELVTARSLPETTLGQEAKEMADLLTALGHKLADTIEAQQVARA